MTLTPDYAEELANITASKWQRDVAARRIRVLIDAGETSLAIELDAELRAAISNGTEMGEAA